MHASRLPTCPRPPCLCRPQAATLDDALAIVNGNEHGNGTAIFTRSGAAARRFQVRASSFVLILLTRVRCTSAHSPLAEHCR